ncbi:hypothetical protein AB0I30_17180 [Nocardia tengchongensis]|uniref:hypothetical protein n=1 Tax=Nocardia tengchongensis TaxID=2055889 RepID=UPI0033E35F56
MPHAALTELASAVSRRPEPGAVQNIRYCGLECSQGWRVAPRRTYCQHTMWWQRKKTSQASVSYEQAFEIVRADIQSGLWKQQAPWMRFCIDDREIVENDKLFKFRVLPRESLRASLMTGEVPIGGSVTVVYKADGGLEIIAGGAFFRRESNRRDRARWGNATTSRPNPNPRLIMPAPWWA